MVVGCHQQPTIVASFFDNGGCTLMATNPTGWITQIADELNFTVVWFS
jgi:hypothetical protein